MKEGKNTQYSEGADYTVLLFYKYVGVANPAMEVARQREVCTRLGLTGRVIVASEGINATLEGTDAAISEYCASLSARRPFKNIHFKKSQGTGNAFPKLSVKVRSEIVTLGLGLDQDVNPQLPSQTGKRLKPEQLHKWLRSRKDIHIVDMRNDYEQKVGHFEGSILPGMENFRDLPKVLPKLAHLKDKKVVTVCTGGVRCEKASGYLLQQGFKDVYQLDGGIVSYMEKYVGQDFKGKLYVFDQRIAMGFKEPESEADIVGRCERCQKPSERYVNCANLGCHLHFICCEVCQSANGNSYCSKKCEE